MLNTNTHTNRELTSSTGATDNQTIHSGLTEFWDAVDRFLRNCWHTLRLRTCRFSIGIVWSAGNQPRLPSRILSPSNQPVPMTETTSSLPHKCVIQITQHRCTNDLSRSDYYYYKNIYYATVTKRTQVRNIVKSAMLKAKKVEFT